MNKSIRLVVAVAIVTMMTACTPFVLSSENRQRLEVAIKTTDIGERPADYEQLILAELMGKLSPLKDPASARIRHIDEPYEGYIGANCISGELNWAGDLCDFFYGYVVTFIYNAKNSYGGYGNPSEGLAVIQRDRIVHMDYIFEYSPRRNATDPVPISQHTRDRPE